MRKIEIENGPESFCNPNFVNLGSGILLLFQGSVHYKGITRLYSFNDSRGDYIGYAQQEVRVTEDYLRGCLPGTKGLKSPYSNWTLS